MSIAGLCPPGGAGFAATDVVKRHNVSEAEVRLAVAKISGVLNSSVSLFDDREQPSSPIYLVDHPSSCGFFLAYREPDF